MVARSTAGVGLIVTETGNPVRRWPAAKRVGGMHAEEAIIAQAREREARYIEDIKAHPNAPRRFDDFLLVPGR